MLLEKELDHHHFDICQLIEDFMASSHVTFNTIYKYTIFAICTVTVP